MKTFLSPLAGLALAGYALAQTSLVPSDKAEEWLRTVHEIQKSKNFKKYELLDPRNPEIPPGMMDTLAKYDWVEVGSFWYEEAIFSDGFNEISNRYNFTRFEKDGTMNEYVGGEDSTGGSFSINYHAYNVPWQLTIEKMKGYTWLCWETEDCMRLVSYGNGVLMYDLEDGMGEFGDIHYPRRYRTVCIAVPRMF